MSILDLKTPSVESATPATGDLIDFYDISEVKGSPRKKTTLGDLFTALGGAKAVETLADNGGLTAAGRLITSADNGASFLSTAEDTSIILPANPSFAARFTVGVPDSDISVFTLTCASAWVFLASAKTAGSSDGTASLPPGSYAFAVEAIAGTWYVTNAS